MRRELVTDEDVRKKERIRVRLFLFCSTVALLTAREPPCFRVADPTAAELKLKDVGDKTVSISTAPQNRREAPPMGVAVALCPIWSPGTGLLHPLCLCNSLLLRG